METDSSLAVVTTDLNHRFGRVDVLRSVHMTVRTGTVYGLIGPNGAGKSTLLSVILGLVRPTSGAIRIFGRPWSNDSLNHIGATLNGPAFYPHLTATENLQIHAHLIGADRSHIRAALEQVDLPAQSRAKAGTFSTGMKSRLALAIALLGDPEILILDEPQNGLDPVGIASLRQMLRTRVDDGKTVIVSSHLLDEIAHLADDIGILVDGRLHHHGPLNPDENNTTLEEVFFDIIGNSR
ncbi:ABC-2 type transport system ATP-binding protein [Austwickia chelonae]|nr:ATP-binding cassette domain-containing protein [Austwickia chelonae]SEW37103.1 ABC-2 type transport system ATP-binding protein [Austwickia chelonae]